MDHLKTSSERRSRWYCQSVWPRYLAVRQANVCWKDLLRVPPQNVNDPLQQQDRFDYEFVYSVPFQWLISSKPTTKGANSDGPPPCDLLARTLKVHGFAVVSGVLSPDDCSHALDLAWDWMEAASAAELHVQRKQTHDEDIMKSKTSKRRKTGETPIVLVSRDDASDHSKACRTTQCFPRTCEGGMMPFYGSGHSSFAWMIRSHPNVLEIFASLHGTTRNKSKQYNLLSSLDGFVLWTQRQQQQQEKRTDAGWFHIDQNPKHKPGAAAVQGLVNLIDVTPSTGGNALVIQSHHEFSNRHYYHQDEQEQKNTTTTTSSVRDFYRQRLLEVGNDDWLEIDPNDKVLLNPQRVVSLLLRAGDVLLWDSRVVHCSYPPAKEEVSITNTNPAKDTSSGDPQDAKGFLRAATLVSMIPESSPPSLFSQCNAVSKEVKALRKEAVGEARTLTHWVDKVAPLGEERSQDVVLEQSCVDYIKEHYKQVLLGWDDLSPAQQRLVVGDDKD